MSRYRYREIFAAGEQPDPGRVLYTIRREDVGKSTLHTETGLIDLGSFMGSVKRRDVGKRVYRVPCDDPRAGWVWQLENRVQLDERHRGTST